MRCTGRKKACAGELWRYAKKQNKEM